MTLIKEEDQTMCFTHPTYIKTGPPLLVSPFYFAPLDLKRQHPSSLLSEGTGSKLPCFVRQSALMDPLSTLFLVM